MRSPQPCPAFPLPPPVGTEPIVEPRQQEGTADGRGADRSEHNAVEHRAAADLVSHHKRQQRPIGARKQQEAGRSDQCRDERRIVTCVAKARPDRAQQMLRGRRAPLCSGSRHQTSAPIEPKLLTALIQNGAAMPKAPRSAPPRAGPTARLTLTPALFATTALGRSELGTSRGRSPGKQGRSTRRRSNEEGKNQQAYRRDEVKPDQCGKHGRDHRDGDFPAMRNLRLSTMSVSAPAGIANRNIGRLLATCTRETTSGAELRLIISQPEAAVYIHQPTFETTVAVQITANVLWREGRSWRFCVSRIGCHLCAGLLAYRHV